MTVMNRMDYVLIPMGPTTVAAIWDIVVMESTALVSKLMHIYFEKGHSNKWNYVYPKCCAFHYDILLLVYRGF